MSPTSDFGKPGKETGGGGAMRCHGGSRLERRSMMGVGGGVLMFEARHVPAFRDISLQALQLTPWLTQGKSRFWAGVRQEEEVGCRLWQGLCLPRGVSWG